MTIKSLRRRRRLVFVLVALIATLAIGAFIAARRLAGPAPAGTFRVAAVSARAFLVARDVPYRTVGSWTGLADVYTPPGRGPFPVVLYFHGGGWVTGSKADAAIWAPPLVLNGYALVAVSYRLAAVARAPAAVEDARCALAWVREHALTYKLDRTRVVTLGDSAGGHLALMVGLLHGSDEFAGGCGAARDPVRAVVNVSGIADVRAIRDEQLRTQSSPGSWPFAVEWIGDASDPRDRAHAVSPLTWIDRNDPPVFTVHGTADDLVPFAQAMSLHDALVKAGVRNDLVALHGRGHGDFTLPEIVTVLRRMFRFLDLTLSTPRA